MLPLPPNAVMPSLGAPPPSDGVYRPSEADTKLIGDTTDKFKKWRQNREPHEPQWFINNAFFRNQHYTEYDEVNRTVRRADAAPKRIRLKINRLQAKVRTRIAKFVKNRPKPVVTPATSEYQDYLKARATERSLEYHWRKQKLEQKFKDVLYSAKDCGKAFMWLHWDKTKKARIMSRDPQTGRATYAEEVLGDVMIETGSAFQLLIADPSIEHIGDQPEIMRITVRAVADAKRRFPEIASFITGDSSDDNLFQYERQIAALTPAGLGAETKKKENAKKDFVTIKEHFIRPCGTYPNGHYRVLCGTILAKHEDELPYGFSDMENPYPVVEFVDMYVSGSFWCPTITELLVDLQREYNLMRSKLAEHTRVMAFPKLFAAKQHQLPKNAWNADPGELIEYASYPGIPAPQPWTPPQINQDVWKLLDLLQKEFDDISQIFPVSEGSRGGTTSGFQANLLQEASDTVHGPDLRSHELSLEDLYQKIRRLMKLGYTMPRLMALNSSGYTAEVFEFSSEMIDEYADVHVEIGSGLPLFKAARQETVMQLYNSGMMGDIADPDVRRRALSLLEMGSIQDAFDGSKADENQARWENVQFGYGAPTQDPEFWEDHKIHYNQHTDWLKSPEGRSATPNVRMAVIRHTVLHARFINPQSALQIAQEAGLQDPDVIARIVALLPPPPPPPMGGAPGDAPVGPGPDTPGPPAPGPSGPPPGPAAAQPGPGADGSGAPGPRMIVPE